MTSGRAVVTAALAACAVAIAACGSGGNQTAKASPSAKATTSALPCHTAQCLTNNYHRQDLTFSGAVSGHADRALVLNCESGSAGGFVLVFSPIPLGQVNTSLRIDIGSNYHGPGKYQYGLGDVSFVDGTVTDPRSTAQSPIRYTMTAGNFTVNSGQQSGSLDAGFAAQGDPAKRAVHVSGAWSCNSPRP
jgi:hypothetical protein